MVKKKVTEFQTTSQDAPICPECSRRFKENDFTWFTYDTSLVCDTSSRCLYPERLARDEDYSYQSAINVEYLWKFGVCDFCAREKYELDFVNPRDLDAALADSNEPLPDGGIVNSYETIHESKKVDTEKIFCNRCWEECETDEHLFHIEPTFTIDKDSTGSFEKSYVNKKWDLQKSPDWSEVANLEYRGVIHLCSDCFKEIRPSFSFRLNRRLKRIMD